MVSDMDFDQVLQFSDKEFASWLEENREYLSIDTISQLKNRAEMISSEGNLTCALSIFARAELIAQELTDPLAMGLVWRGRANVYQRYGCFEESLNASQAATRIYRQHSNALEVAKTRTLEVYTLGMLGKFDEAIALSAWVDEQFQDLPIGQARLAANLAQVYTQAWKLDLALQAYERAQKLYMQLDQPDIAACMLHDMGVAADQLDRLELAERYYQQAYPILKETGDHFVSGKVSFQ